MYSSVSRQELVAVFCELGNKSDSIKGGEFLVLQSQLDSHEAL